MADTSFVSASGALKEAQDVQTLLAGAVMHLFLQAFTPTPLSQLSDFLAAECNFDGYAPATISAWANPVLAGNAYAIYAPTQTFRWSLATGVGNMVGGYFLVTSGGVLWDYTVANPAEAVSGPGMAFIRTPVEVFPWG